MAARFGGRHQQLLGVDFANVVLYLVNLLGVTTSFECTSAACHDNIAFARYCRILYLSIASLQESCNWHLSLALSILVHKLHGVCGTSGRISNLQQPAATGYCCQQLGN